MVLQILCKLEVPGAALVDKQGCMAPAEDSLGEVLAVRSTVCWDLKCS